MSKENQALNTGGEGNTIDTEATPLLKQMQERVDASTEKWVEPFKEIRRIRRFITGNKNDRGEAGSASFDASGRQVQQANIAYSTLQTLLPLLYARDPDLTAKPSQNVDPQTDSYKTAGLFAETLEIVASKAVKEAGIKAVAKQAIRDTQINAVSMVKVGYQADYYRDPIINNRIEDLQAKLASLRGTAQEANDPDSDDEEVEANMELMQNQIDALQGEVEVLRAEGLVIDPFPIEDFRLDPQLDSLQRYRDAGWMAQCTWMQKKQARDQFALDDDELNHINCYKRNVNGIPERMGHKLATDVDKGDVIEHKPEILPIWELWDRSTNTVYTWGEGGKEWVRDPWQPERMGKRWYPFFMLAFNWRDSTEEWPISEAALLENLCREYDTIRKQAYEHRKLCKPTYVTDGSLVSDANDIKKYTIADIGEVVTMNAAGRDIDTVIRPAIHPPFNPQIYDTSGTLADIDRVSGVGDAQRGSVQRAKTATEANIQQGGLTGRMDEKRDQLEDWLTEIYRFAAEILIQTMSAQEVMRLAGPQAYWPQINKEELYTMVEVEVRAGSTGKPDQEKDLAEWTQIMPMIMENAQFIMQMRGEGVPDKDNIYIQILLETLKRVDDRIDLEKFLPGEPVEEEQRPELGMIGPGGADPMDQQPGGAQGDPQMQQQQMEQQMQQEQQMAQEQQMQAEGQQAQQGMMEAESHQQRMQGEEQKGAIAARKAEQDGMTTEQRMNNDQEAHEMKMAQGTQKMQLEARKAIAAERNANKPK